MKKFKAWQFWSTRASRQSCFAPSTLNPGEVVFCWRCISTTVLVFLNAYNSHGSCKSAFKGRLLPTRCFRPAPKHWQFNNSSSSQSPWPKKLPLTRLEQISTSRPSLNTSARQKTLQYLNQQKDQPEMSDQIWFPETIQKFVPHCQLQDFYRTKRNGRFKTFHPSFLVQIFKKKTRPHTTTQPSFHHSPSSPRVPLWQTFSS